MASVEPDHEQDHAHFTHEEREQIMKTERNRQDKRIDKRLLWTYIITLVIFILLAWRSEVNNASIDRNNHHIAELTWNNCNNLNTRALTVNKTNTAIIAFLSDITPPPPGLAGVIAVYKAGILPISDCGPKPTG